MSFSVLQAGVRFLLQMSLPEILINQFGGGGGLGSVGATQKNIFVYVFCTFLVFTNFK